MYNWSTDTKKLKLNKDQLTKWQLEQAINYGLNGQKLSARVLKKYLSKLDVDTKRKKFLQLLLNGK